MTAKRNNNLTSIGVLGVSDSLFADIERERKEKWERRTKVWAKMEEECPAIAQLRGLAISGLISDEADGRAAHDAYFKLLGAGLETSEAFEMAIGLAVLTCLPRSANRHTNSKPVARAWYEGSGKTPKTLAYFSLRLKNVADEIEKLNSHTFFKPETWVKTRNLSSDAAKRVFAVWFERLPILLHHYAAFVDAHSKSLRETFKQRSRARGPNTSTQALVGLVNMVRKETGRPHYSELATILNAAGRKAGVKKDFSPDELKMSVSRYRKQQPNESGLPLEAPSR
jgi:hypothetical protein